MSADPWTATVASLAGQPAPALPAGRGRRHRLQDSDHDLPALAHDLIHPLTTKDTDMAPEQRFLRAGADVLQAALVQIQRDDPQGASAVAEMLRGGAMAKLSATLSARTGIGWLECAIVLPNGDAHVLTTVELHRQVAEVQR